MGLDIAIRAAGASVLLLTAAVLLLSAPRSPVARWFLPLALGLAGFLGVNTAFDAAELPGPLWALASFASRMAAVFLWVFCLVLFDGSLRHRGVALAAGAVWLLLVVLDKGYLMPAPTRIDLSAIQIALGAALVVHAGWRVLRELPDDLIERRRRARPVFALGLLALLSMDFVVDLLQGYGWRPPSFLLLQNATFLLLATGLAAWLLRADAGLLATRDSGQVSGHSAATADAAGVPAPDAAPEPSDAPAGDSPRAVARDPELALLARLQAFMRDERPHLDPELDFSRFASRLGVAEPLLRRVINHRLGHGHFRSFLNGYRVEEAKRRLRDPASAGDKIVAVALDSGFSSLASFNRAFRQVAGCAPSEYRAQAAQQPDGAPALNARRNGF